MTTCALCEASILPAAGRALLRVSNAEICPVCAGREERRETIETGRAPLYLNETAGTVSDWLGTLRFAVLHVQHSTCPGFHGVRVPVVTFRFIGPLGEKWVGRVQGAMTLAHCRRVKGWRS